MPLNSLRRLEKKFKPELEIAKDYPRFYSEGHQLSGVIDELLFFTYYSARTYILSCRMLENTFTL